MEENREKTEKKKMTLAAFFAALIAFPSKFLAFLSETLIGRFFLGQDSFSSIIGESRFATRLRDGRMGNAIPAMRRRIALLFDRSRLGTFYRTVADICRFTEVRTYGVLFSTFGFYSMLVYAIPEYAIASSRGDRVILWTGITVFVIGFVLLFSKKPISTFAEENPLLSFILYRVFSLTHNTHVRRSKKTISPTAAFFIGSALGIAGFFLHPLWLITGVILTVGFFAMLTSPELALFSAILTAPFLIFFERPTVILAVVVLIGTGGYFFKVLLGKRSFSFRPLDLTVLLLAALYLGGILITAGGAASRGQAVITLILLCGYFLAANLLNTPEKIYRAIALLLFGGATVSVIGLIQQFSGNAIAAWLDSAAYDHIAGRITSVFENPNVLGAYLVLLFPLSAAGLVKKGRSGARIASALVFLLLLTATVYTWSRGAWIGVVLSLALFIFALAPAMIYVLIPTLVALPFLLEYGAGAIAFRFSSILSASDSSIAYRLSIWQGSFAMAGDHLFSGVGVGSDAFTAVYPLYAPAGAEAAPHAHNLLLQYLCEFGILGPILFLLFVAFFFQCVITHQKEETFADFRLLGLGLGCGVFAVLIGGIFDHVFYNSRVFFLFFVVVGIMSAVSRVGRTRRERTISISDRENEAYSTDITIL